MKPYNILFLCTHNSARSILGEALATTHTSGRFTGYSAGSTPATQINPFATEMIQEMGYDTSKLRSKNWGEFALLDAPKWISLLRFAMTRLAKYVQFGQAIWPQLTGAFLILRN